MSNITVVVDLDRGDCGKGRVADCLGQDFNIFLKNNGSDNSGHTCKIGEKTYKLHHIPAGVLNPNAKNLLGAGMVVNPKTFSEEIEYLEKNGIDTSKVYIDGNTHVNLPYLYPYLDSEQENSREISIGSTKKGTSPAYSNKYARYGIKYWELINNIDKDDWLLDRIFQIYWKNGVDNETLLMQDYNTILEKFSIIKDRIVDGRRFLRDAINNNESIIVESSQGTYLDMDLGFYPYVTSCCTTSANACIGSGIGLKEITDIVGVFKAYSTYVGNGSYIGECDEINGNFLVEKGHEYGTTTGRKRRVGWLSIPMIKDAIQINSVTSLFMTKIDVLSGLEKVKIVKAYELDGENIDYVPSNPADYDRCKPIYEEFDGWEEIPQSGLRFINDLPKNAMNYIRKISDYIGRPINIVSYGPERNQFVGGYGIS